MDKKIEMLESIIAEKDLEIFNLKQDINSRSIPNMTIFSNLSHEVRTPLNGIVGFSELLNSGDLSTDEIKQYAGIIAESCGMLMSLLTDVFDIVKIESTKFHVYKTTFDLNDLIFDIYREYTTLAESKNLQLYLDNLISEQFLVMSDPEVISRVLKKLLDNAIKFTKEGYVVLKYEVENEKIIFSVEDTGIGISLKNRENLFNRFTTEEVSKSRHLGGTGIDLTLCQGLIKLLGGEIWLIDKDEKGSIFQFSLLNEI